MSGDTSSELTDYSAFSELIAPLSPAWQPESIYSPSTVSSLSEYNHLFNAGGYAPSVAESEKTVIVGEIPKFTRGLCLKADRITKHGRMAESKCDQCRSVRGVIVECINLDRNTKCARCTKLGKSCSFQGGSVTGTETEDPEDPPTPPR